MKSTQVDVIQCKPNNKRDIGRPLTELFSGLFAQTAGHVRLEFSQRGGPQRLKVDLDLVWVRVAQRRLSRLNDVNHTAQLVACKTQRRPGHSARVTDRSETSEVGVVSEAPV